MGEVGPILPGLRGISTIIVGSKVVLKSVAATATYAIIKGITGGWGAVVPEVQGEYVEESKGQEPDILGDMSEPGPEGFL